jgi:hypothetical protein
MRRQLTKACRDIGGDEFRNIEETRILRTPSPLDFVTLPSSLNDARSFLKDIAQTYFRMTSYEECGVLAVGKWRVPDGFHSHDFPVLNCVAFSGGTCWPHGQVEEGDWFYFKSRFSHAPETRTNQNKDKPRLTILCAP